MLRLGVIGTGMISEQFIRASHGVFKVIAVASRREESARQLLNNTGMTDARWVASMEELVTEPLDLIYIASPNSLHAQHALTAIKAGINVIVEKPAFWNPAQWEDVFSAADEHGVLVFEAARNVYEPGFAAVAQAVQEREVTSASFTFAQYSSRWDAVLTGDVPNIFSLDFGGGALVDLGVYTVYAAVAWFGEPTGVTYMPSLAPTGVDAHGTLVLSYPGFDVSIRIAKDFASSLPSEIYCGRERLIFDGVQDIRAVHSVQGEETSRVFEVGTTDPQPLHQLMRYEVEAISSLISSHLAGDLSNGQRASYLRLTELSRVVNKVCTKARHDAGIFFTGESETAEIL